MANLVKKTQVAPFVNAGTATAPDWTRIKKSTAFTLVLNPEVKTFDFISSDVPQNEIDKYAPSLSQDITMLKGEPDYQLFMDMLFKLPTGEAAHRDMLIVFYAEKTVFTPAGSSEEIEIFKAWKTDALVQLNQMDTINENITVDFSLNEPQRGAIKVEDGEAVFIAGEFDDDTGEFTPTQSAGGASVTKYAVTFDADGGTGTDPEAAQVVSGGTYRLPANPYTAPTDKHFKAWEVDGVEYGAGEDITVTEDITVKAVWEDD